MKINLNKLLTPKSGNPVYNAAYTAYYNRLEANTVVDSQDIDDPELISINSKQNDERKKKIEDDSDKFASDFCNALKDGKFMENIADEIDGHIKSMMLSINIPALLPTIISPMGPCTGTLQISEATGAIITIS